MQIETTTGDTIDIENPMDEWVQLSESSHSFDERVFFETGNWLLLVRTKPVLGPVEVIAAGKDIRASVEYDREEIASRLEEEFADTLDESARTAVLDWYEGLVRELVREDLYDPSVQTTFVDGTVYLSTGMDVQSLSGEIALALKDWDEDVSSEIAEQVNDWWALSQTGTVLRDEVSYAASVEVES